MQISTCTLQHSIRNPIDSGPLCATETQCMVTTLCRYPCHHYCLPLPFCLLLCPAYSLLLPLSYCQLLVHCCCTGGVCQENSLITTCVASVKSRHTASTQVTMEGSARRALTLPTALVVPSLCQMTTIGILPSTQTQLSAVQTRLHAG